MPISPLAAALLALTLPADDPLTIGDPAPALDIAHWMKGSATSTFEPGHVYVLEFWATWCGPCIGNMEHLSKVQEEHSKRDVHVIGLSDEPLQTTVAFLFLSAPEEGRLQNDRTRYALATDPDRSVHRDYFEAANQRSIPKVFIIGRDAHVEWIGHPMDMDPVLEAVLDGTWERAAHRAAALDKQRRNRAITDAERRLSVAVDEQRWHDTLEPLDVLIDHEPHYIPTKVGILLSRMRDYERGFAAARDAIEQAWATNGLLLHQLAWYLSCNHEFPIDPEHLDLDLALRAAERSVELDATEYHLTMLAQVHALRGDGDAAVAAQTRAIETLEAMRPHIRPEEVDMYEDDLRQLRATLDEYRGL